MFELYGYPLELVRKDFDHLHKLMCHTKTTKSFYRDCDPNYGISNALYDIEFKVYALKMVEELQYRMIDVYFESCFVEFLDFWSPRIYPRRFGLATAQLLPQLKSTGEGVPAVTSQPDGPAIFNSMSWHSDMCWDEVRFKSLLVYLRGNTSLRLPAEWKAVFPTKIWSFRGAIRWTIPKGLWIEPKCWNYGQQI